MTYREAIELLDLRKAGADMPEAVVLKALEVTGDVTPDRHAVLSKAMRELVGEAA